MDHCSSKEELKHVVSVSTQTLWRGENLPLSPFHLYHVSYKDLRFFVNNILAFAVINIPDVEPLLQARLFNTHSSRYYSSIRRRHIFTRVWDLIADEQHAVKSLRSTFLVLVTREFFHVTKGNLKEERLKKEKHKIVNQRCLPRVTIDSGVRQKSNNPSVPET